MRDPGRNVRRGLLGRETTFFRTIRPNDSPNVRFCHCASPSPASSGQRRHDRKVRPSWPVLDLPDLLQYLAGSLVRVGQPCVHGLGERLDGQVPGWPCRLLRFRFRLRLARGMPGEAVAGCPGPPRSARRYRAPSARPGTRRRPHFDLADGHARSRCRGALRRGQQTQQDLPGGRGDGRGQPRGGHLAGPADGGRRPLAGGPGCRQPRPHLAHARCCRFRSVLLAVVQGQFHARAGRAWCPCGRPRCACSRPARPGARRAGTCARGR